MALVQYRQDDLDGSQEAACRNFQGFDSKLYQIDLTEENFSKLLSSIEFVEKCMEHGIVIDSPKDDDKPLSNSSRVKRASTRKRGKSSESIQFSKTHLPVLLTDRDSWIKVAREEGLSWFAISIPELYKGLQKNGLPYPSHQRILTEAIQHYCETESSLIQFVPSSTSTNNSNVVVVHFNAPGYPACDPSFPSHGSVFVKRLRTLSGDWKSPGDLYAAYQSKGSEIPRSERALHPSSSRALISAIRDGRVTLKAYGILFEEGSNGKVTLRDLRPEEATAPSTSVDQTEGVQFDEQDSDDARSSFVPGTSPSGFMRRCADWLREQGKIDPDYTGMIPDELVREFREHDRRIKREEQRARGRGSN